MRRPVASMTRWRPKKKRWHWRWHSVTHSSKPNSRSISRIIKDRSLTAKPSRRKRLGRLKQQRRESRSPPRPPAVEGAAPSAPIFPIPASSGGDGAPPSTDHSKRGARPLLHDQNPVQCSHGKAFL